jgi:transcription antitermination factor NusG
METDIAQSTEAKAAQVQEKSDSEKWFALYTNPRAEKKVNQELKKAGYVTYLPLHRTPRVWSDRIKLVDMPLFTSYVFIRCEESIVSKFYFWPKIVKVLYHNGKPAVIKQKEIDAIKIFLEAAAERPLCTGDEVEILAGSMKKICGVITRLNRKFIYLKIEHLNAVVCVNITSVAHKNRLH